MAARGEFLRFSLAVSLHLCVRVCRGDGVWGPADRRRQRDLDRAAKRVPFATKISPAVIEVITAIRNHALAAFPPSRGRIVAALVVVSHAPR